MGNDHDRFITRDELNSSLVRMEENQTNSANRIEKRIEETNKIIREQNAQFALLLGQEAGKRETWCEGHNEEHKELVGAINKRSASVAWKVVGYMAAFITGSLLTLIAYLLAYH